MFHVSTISLIKSLHLSETVPRDSVLKITYGSMTLDSKQACTLTSTGPKRQVIIPATPLSYLPEATLALHAKVHGQYEVCIQCTRSSSLEKNTKWSLRFDHVGDLAMMTFDKDSATIDQVKSTAVQLNELIARAVDMNSEIIQERVEDDEIRHSADSTSLSVLTASIIQLGLILLMNQYSAWSIGKFIRQAQVV